MCAAVRPAAAADARGRTPSAVRAARRAASQQRPPPPACSAAEDTTTTTTTTAAAATTATTMMMMATAGAESRPRLTPLPRGAHAWLAESFSVGCLSVAECLASSAPRFAIDKVCVRACVRWRDGRCAYPVRETVKPFATVVYPSQVRAPPPPAPMRACVRACVRARDDDDDDGGAVD
eukprot:scaffold1189_cov315-Prasinococcus_capsulatus_cf.AAC.5